MLYDFYSLKFNDKAKVIENANKDLFKDTIIAIKY